MEVKRSHLASADGSDALHLLPRLQLEGSTAFHLLVPELHSSALLRPDTQIFPSLRVRTHNRASVCRSAVYSRLLLAAGDDEPVSQRGVHGEHRPRVSLRHHPEQVVISPHVHVPVNGARERQVILRVRQRVLDGNGASLFSDFRGIMGDDA